jgi:hypothetical protein
MARASSFGIEIDGIGTIDMMKDLGEVASGCFKKEVVMVAHEAIGMYQCPVSFTG